ncbi:SARP family transcriptional regulator [Catellatospora methionotrophica]|uniref:SARP family transcriptional regulator n=1 Tax=Catellatospora methionotrophica TaxID=121620 RepID=A0A8J3PHF8_9ACTN|nr:BTAD domain-containing putative transcriptional regulator [Catellatospora methionotrophica]GIG16684.1 SARP family transcriptional regulator [Catellatospora methionotrophica]
MRFGILGPVEAFTGDHTVTLGQPRHRALLAYLLLHPHRVTTIDQLIGALWGDDAPTSARDQIHVAVSALRRSLRALPADTAVLTTAGGYRLTLDGATVDAHLFTDTVATARQATAAGAHARAAGLLTDALALWRGEALADVRAAFAATARQRLKDHRLDAEEQLADAELARGRPEQAIRLLSDLVELRPSRERLAGRLMLALHGCGRTAEAMQVYENLRRHLAQEYGTDPGPAVRQVHLQLLRGTLRASPPPAGPDRTARVVPRQLPAAPAVFAGRRREWAQLDGVLAAMRPRTPAVVAVVGTAGVGKTALALNWAHSVADRFPDGQLYLNLRGFDGRRPMGTAEAVRTLIDAVAEDVHQIPERLDAQIGLLRSLLAERSVLLVLDNVRDAEQARPLLPGSAASLTVVTSRNQLPGLVAAEGAEPVLLDLLSAAEARELLGTRLGPRRVAEAGAAVDAIVQACARLPLALTIVAARAATYPDLALSRLADELRPARHGLDPFAGPDTEAGIRAAFRWSYQALSASGAALFRLLGLHPGPDVAAPAAASLAAVPLRAARLLLVELVHANLLAEHAPGRWSMHDLLRTFAAELAEESLPEQEQAQAVRRLVDHLLHTAHAADTVLQPFRKPTALAPAPDGVTVHPVSDMDEALAWFDGERAALLAAVDRAAEAGWDEQAWLLAWSLETYLDRRARWREWHDSQLPALAAAQRHGSPSMRASSHRGLATALSKMGRHDEAYGHHQQGLALSTAIGDGQGAARSLRSIAFLLEEQGRHDEALTHAREAVAVSDSLGDAMSAARARNLVGWLHAQLGDHQQALAHCQRAARELDAMGNRNALAHTLDSLGFIHRCRGEAELAVSYYLQAVRLYRETGHRYGEAESLIRLGETHQAVGATEACAQAWEAASAILDDLPNAVAAQLRDSIPI